MPGIAEEARLEETEGDRAEDQGGDFVDESKVRNPKVARRPMQTIGSDAPTVWPEKESATTIGHPTERTERTRCFVCGLRVHDRGGESWISGRY